MFLSLSAALFLATCTADGGAPQRLAAVGTQIRCAPGLRVRDLPKGRRLVIPRASLTLPFRIDGPVVHSPRMPKAPVDEVAFLAQERRPEIAACIANALDRRVNVVSASIVLEANIFAGVEVTVTTDDRALRRCIAAAFVDTGPTFIPGHPFRVEIPLEVTAPTSGPRAPVQAAPHRTRPLAPDVCVAGGMPVAEGTTEPLSIDLRPDVIWMTQGRPLMMCGSGAPDLAALAEDVDAWDACLAPAAGVHGTIGVSLVVDAAGTVRGEPKILSQELEGGQPEARAALPACVLQTLATQRLGPRAGGRPIEVQHLELRIP